MQLFPTYTIMPETSSDVTPADCVLGEALTDPCTEDASLCGKSFSKERLAWYLYDAGNSAIGGVALLIFIPLLLSNLALNHAYSGSSVDSCTSVDGVSCNNDFCYMDNSPNTGLTTMDCTHCIQSKGLQLWDAGLQEFVDWSPPRVDFFGSNVDPMAFASLTISVSVAVQAIVFISLGAFADHYSYRYYGMLSATLIAQATAICFIFLSSGSLYLTAAILTMVLNASFGVGGVFYNAYLPVLVDAHPDLKGYGGVNVPRSLQGFREELMDRTSAYGFMWGYAASGVIMVLCFGLTIILGSEDEEERLALRASVMMCGIWWALLTPITFCWLKKRPGPPLPKYTPKYLVILHGWKSILGTLRDAIRYRHTGIFLVCFFFYSDALSSITYLGVLFAQESLCFSITQQAIMLIIIWPTSVLGNYLYVRLKKAFKLRTKTVILINLAVYSVVCLYGTLGLIDSLPFGLKTTAEMYIFAAVHGLHVGALQSFQRALFADLIIPGRETEFFSLYAITDKGSSWLGPFVIGIIKQTTGSFRGGFIYLLIMLVLPALGLAIFVDHDQGLIDVGRMKIDLTPETPVRTKSSS